MSLPRRWRNISRICRSMAISRPGDWATGRPGNKKPRGVSLCLLFLCCWNLVSCTSIRPVIKIGLLAPFEGLQRRSGYVALTAMRQAIADSAPVDVAIMPLALDSGADPLAGERATRKLLQDVAVGAIVGPYSPLLMQQMAPVVTATGLPWLFPFAVNPTRGFVVPDAEGDWALPLVTAAAATAATLGRDRLVVAGWTPGWPQLATVQLQSTFALPLGLHESVAAIQSTDAVLWLGDAEAGAVYFTALRARFASVPFLLGPQADEPIFSEQTQISGPVYLLYWQDDGYEQWRTRYPDGPSMAYLTYRATQTAIARSLGQSSSASWSWHIETIALSGDTAQ